MEKQNTIEEQSATKELSDLLKELKQSSDEWQEIKKAMIELQCLIDKSKDTL